jgi:predicted nucleic acid-binding protein
VPFVVDASVTLAWCLSEASSAAADAVLDRLRNDFALVPSGRHDEVANGFLVAEHRNRITAVGTAAQLAGLRALGVRVVASSDASWSRPSALPARTG